MKYPFSCFPVTNGDPEDVIWVAKSDSLTGCVAQGPSPLIAIAYLEFNEREWLNAAFTHGVYIPPVPLKELDDTDLSVLKNDKN